MAGCYPACMLHPSVPSRAAGQVGKRVADAPRAWMRLPPLRHGYTLTGATWPMTRCVLFPILVTPAVYRPRIRAVGTSTPALRLRGRYLIEVTR
jgi:hypothetical protein